MKKIISIIFLYSLSLFAIDSTYVAFAGSTEANGYYAAIDTTYMFGVLCPIFFNGVCEITKTVENPEGKYEGSWWDLDRDSNNRLYSAGIDETNVEENPVIEDWDLGSSGINPVPVCYFGEYLQYSKLRFNETSTESGQFDISDPLIIRHNNFKNHSFSGIDGEDFYTNGKVTVSVIPDGLALSVIRIDSITLNATLSGIATSHDNSDDIYMRFYFHDTAFTKGDSGTVYNVEKSCAINFRQKYNVAPSGGDFTSIRDAYNDGSGNYGGGDIIYVAQGIYDETTILFRRDTDIIGSGIDNTIMQYDLGGTFTDYLFEVVSKTLNLSNIHLRYGSITSNENDGGAINISKDAVVNLDNVLITESKGGYGGAVCNRGTLSISNSVIKDCEGNSGGAIYNDYNSEMHIENSTINDNNSTYDGGAIYNMGFLNLENTTVAYNTSARNAGGIYSGNYSDLYLTNCTITKNTAATVGGGIAIGHTPVSICNTIIAENTADSIPNDYHVLYGVTLNDNGYNCVGYQTVQGTPNNWYFTEPTNILFDMRADSTASTEWTRNNIALTNQTLGLDSTLANNFTKNGTQTVAVLNGSFLIDAGTNQDLGDLTIPELDQRGWDRYGMVDIGAYEHGTASYPRNVNAVSNGEETTLNWDSVEGALSYIIYASVKPYSDFQDLTDFGEFNNETRWTVPYAGQKMFFYVVSNPSDRKSVPIDNVTDKMILEYLRK